MDKVPTSFLSITSRHLSTVISSSYCVPTCVLHLILPCTLAGADKCIVEEKYRTMSEVFSFFVVVFFAILPMTAVTCYSVFRWRSLERQVGQSGAYQPIGQHPLTWQQLSSAINGNSQEVVPDPEEQPLGDPLGSPSAPPAVQAERFTSLFSLQSHFDSWTDRLQVRQKRKLDDDDD